MLVQLGVLHYSSRLVGKDAEKLDIILAEGRAVRPVAYLDHANAPLAYDQGGKNRIAESSSARQAPHIQLIYERLILHVVEQQKVAILPQLPGEATFRDREAVAPYHFFGHPIERRLADQGLCILIVEQDPTYLHTHQMSDTLADLCVDLAEIRERPDGLRDLMQARELLEATFRLSVEARILNSHSRMVRKDFEDFQVLLSKGTYAVAHQLERSHESIAGHQRQPDIGSDRHLGFSNLWLHIWSLSSIRNEQPLLVARDPARVALIKPIESASIRGEAGIARGTPGNHHLASLIPQTDLGTVIVHKVPDTEQNQVERALQIKAG